MFDIFGIKNISKKNGIFLETFWKIKKFYKDSLYNALGRMQLISAFASEQIIFASPSEKKVEIWGESWDLKICYSGMLPGVAGIGACSAQGATW